ncbi:type III PLP-dependent enzyme [Candidatus Magnetominusculus dajiuhuensis]|uniref:type III PLP-dependent enzyme n=1 Tax=Candidatus Magnetominusculus dajiuhuensis TaxID=3137712 RepID=UPI003B43711D
MVKSFKIDAATAKLVEKSTLLKVLNYVDTVELKTPVLLMDGDRIRRNVATIGRGIAGCRVFYAVKANPSVEVLRLLAGLDVGFEISNFGELNVLSALGVDPGRIISSNPVKTVDFIKAAYAYGVRYFSYDSLTEIEKMSQHAPGSNLYVRLAIPNEGSEWPLSKKFGVEIEDALTLLTRAKEKGLNPLGITFHVGSQCNNIYNWNIALDKARLLSDMARDAGIIISLINIGGGYPIKYTKSVLSIEAIERHINRLIRERFYNAGDLGGGGITVHLEPGRAVVGDAGIMVSRVTGKAERLDGRWLYIDVGVFNGLMESIGGIKYTYVTETRGAGGMRDSWTLAGPSCDSFDVIDKNVQLHEPEVGDIVLILSGGAYTISYASEFNGCSIPETLIV